MIRNSKKCTLLLIIIMIFVFLLPQNINAAEIANGLDPRLDNSIILYLDSSKAFVNNIETKIDSNDLSIIPFAKEGRTLVPVRFIAESFNADVVWDNITSTVSISYKGKSIRMRLGDRKMYVNGNEFQLDL